MDDKAVMREKFKVAGLPIARGGCASNFKQALEIFNSIGGEVIVKPRTGSRSRHTTTYITTPEALKIAYDKAKQLSPWVVVEVAKKIAEIKGSGVSEVQEQTVMNSKNLFKLG
jgi:cyanophycin synthetase